MSAEPLLSICVPTFNRAWMLERNVSFHLDAFHKAGIAFEIVVVDDKSTDETQSYIASLHGAAELSAYQRHQNSGFLDNYAFAMRRAKGKYAVFLGDDDLLIPEKVLDYVGRLEADPALGMIQAPWLLVDERPNGGDMGPFYTIPHDVRIARGDHGALADFILGRHIFPEFLIVRREVLSRAISSPCPFIFWAFLFTARALAQGDILFVPEPFARVTAVSNDPRMQQGNKETMFQWDHYRGGVEYIVALALRSSDLPLTARANSTNAINNFMSIREKVALRLLLNGGYWVEAYILIHRIAAYEPLPVTPTQLAEVARMAGFTTAAREAVRFSSHPALLDPSIEDKALAALDAPTRERLVRDASGDLADPSVPRAYLRFDQAFPAALGPKDAVFDVGDYMAQFI